MQVRRAAILGVSAFLMVVIILAIGRDASRSPEGGSEDQSISSADSARSITQPEGTSNGEPVELDSDTALIGNAESSVGGGESAARRVALWPESPETREALLCEEILSGYFGSISLDQITGTTTKCSVLLTKSDAGVMTPACWRFVRYLREPPVNACGVGVRVSEQPGGNFQQEITPTTCRQEPPEGYTEGLGLTEDELREFGAQFLSPEDYDSDPVVVGDDDGIRLVVEHICFVDCPLDLRQVVHWESSAGLGCEEVELGLAESFLARTASGLPEQRTLCVVQPYR